MTAREPASIANSLSVVRRAPLRQDAALPSPAHIGRHQPIVGQREVLALIAGGATNGQAAAQLFVSEATIKTHLLHIYARLNVRDRAAAVGEAYRRGLLP